MTVRLDALSVHPVKSTAGRPLASATVDAWGLAEDRRWMVVTGDGAVLTAREEHGLLGIVADTPATDPCVDAPLRLRAAGSEDLLLDAPSGEPGPVTVHGRPTTGLPVPAARDWLRAALGRDDVDLVVLDRPRPVSDRHGVPGAHTSFTDSCPVTLASLPSLRRLQDLVTETALERGEEPTALSMGRFRPNLVLDGDLEPFAEDAWSTVEAGGVTLRVVGPVDRCVMTTLDPVTRERGHEPIRTLARHRRWDGCTWFAVWAVPTVPGEVAVGDEVTVHR